MTEDERYMKEALAEAGKAFDLGEVPVGAVIVRSGEVIARGHNLTETEKDPTMHAEMIAVREAAAVLGGWRLPGCTMYVTLEPCAMCAGALVWARLDRLVAGAKDPKAGACGSVIDIPHQKKFNHSIEVEYGVLEDECAGMLKEFFRKLRK